VLCGGDLRSARLDAAQGVVSRGGRSVRVPPELRWVLEPAAGQGLARTMRARQELLAPLAVDDTLGDPVCHMAVAANNTGLLPERPVGHRVTARITELPAVYCPVEEGGILEGRGVLDVAYALHGRDDPHGGGGVFIVVANADPVSRAIMVDKGLHANPSGTAMLAYRPFHLCGAETAMSILCAGLLGVPTGGSDLRPRVDMLAVSTVDVAAGESISSPGGLSYDRRYRASLAPAQALGPGRPVPFFMLGGLRAAQPIPAGSVITWEMVERPAGAALWELRQEQDRIFFTKEH